MDQCGVGALGFCLIRKNRVSRRGGTVTRAHSNASSALLYEAGKRTRVCGLCGVPVPNESGPHAAPAEHELPLTWETSSPLERSLHHPFPVPGRLYQNGPLTSPCPLR
jgi:hypothetical protein